MSPDPRVNWNKLVRKAANYPSHEATVYAAVDTKGRPVHAALPPASGTRTRGDSRRKRALLEALTFARWVCWLPI